MGSLQTGAHFGHVGLSSAQYSLPAGTVIGAVVAEASRAVWTRRKMPKKVRILIIAEEEGVFFLSASRRNVFEFVVQ